MIDRLFVDIVTPDEGIGPNHIQAYVTHPRKMFSEFEKDVEDLWAKKEEEEWESDDQLFAELEKLDYSFKYPPSPSVTITL